MSTRKLWSAMYPQIPERCRTRFESKAKAYRWVQNERANWDCHGKLGASRINIYVDERDGQGWQLYEDLDLSELPDWH
jgi:hypothetical protein